MGEFEQQNKAINGIIQRCWEDEAFKKRLLANPRAVFSENGVDVPADLDVRVVENTPDVTYFMIPSKPQPDELSDSDLAAAAGGASLGLAPARLRSFFQMKNTSMDPGGTHAGPGYCLAVPC